MKRKVSSEEAEVELGDGILSTLTLSTLSMCVSTPADSCEWEPA